MKNFKMEDQKEKRQSTDPRGSWREMTLINRIKFFLMIALVLALGFAAVNQALGFFYKAHFLKSPCDLCGELNPQVQECIDNLNSPRASYWTAEGWSDPFSEEGEKIQVNITP